MNIREYISSGIIESYCLGLASAEEATAFEANCVQYPELAAARDDFELQLEKQAFDQAVMPGEMVKSKIMSAISAEKNKQSPVIEMRHSGISGNSKKMYRIAAAAVILFISSAILAVSLYTKNTALHDTAKNLQARLDSARMQIENMAVQQKMISDPSVAVVNMTGTGPVPKTAVNVYWDSTTTDVYLVIRNLPQIPSDKQYQLWALINGQQPKDLGLFDQGNRVMLKMKNTQKADAFAITLEKRGNTGPATGELQASGKPL